MTSACKCRGRIALVGALIFLLGFAASNFAAVELPGNKTVDKVDFERHIMGLLGRMGCNSGSCHGSFQGKGGFRLSLFGYEPAKDYEAITRDNFGRRLSSGDAHNSLLLLKASGQVSHGGGMRFLKGSWQYRIFQEWIEAGAPWSRGSGTVQSIQITPPGLAFKKAGQETALKVQAHFADGATNDITAFCDFRSNDDAVADVSPVGTVKSLRPGGTAIVVSYRGNVLPVRVLVPMELSAEFQYPKLAENNFIDREVFARLRLLNMVPSDPAGDEEFLRRLTIDTIGSLPTPDEIRAFLADQNPNKRAKKIDELLAHPLHAALWATKFSDITGNDTISLELPQQLRPVRSQMWHDWFRKRVTENMPYDQIVKGVVCATSRDGKSVEEWYEQTKAENKQAQKSYHTSYADRDSLDLYWRRQQPVAIEQWGERTAAAFMGIRLECAQCHKHPFDRWSQAEYRAYANIFGQVIATGISEESSKVLQPKLGPSPKKPNPNQPQLREVYLNPRLLKVRKLPHPDTNESLPPKALGGPVIQLEEGKDARLALFEWLRSKDNPFFARSFVNRIWGHYLGVGLVHPVDDFSLANPPSNGKLLDLLAKEFIEHNFDIRHMERIILNSRVYQLGSKTNETNKLDKNNYAHSYVRPMMAEVVVDVLNSALGTSEVFAPTLKPNQKGKINLPTIKPDIRAIELGTSLVQSPTAAYVLRIFGRPPRSSACDCQRAMDPALPQKLFLMTDATLMGKINSPTGRLQSLLKSKRSDDEILEELFLATLSRRPTEADRKSFADYRRTVADRRTLFTDTLWALINTREFILNH
jgi:hypothetical protein